jgi:hypothetical protein
MMRMMRMSLKIKKTKATKTELSSTIDLFKGTGIPLKERPRIAKDIGEIIIDETLKSVSAAKSPLQSKAWPSLSPKYKAFKASKNLTPTANLEFKGDLLDSLKVKPTRDGLKIGHFNTKQAPKADGHNNFTGKSTIPTRRYLPAEGDNFKSSIDSKIRSILTEERAKTAKLPKSRLRGVTTKAEFFAIMEDLFGGATKAEIADAIALSPGLLEELDDLGLLDMIG